LRFLAWYLLKDEIQKETHSSVEDAQAVSLLNGFYAFTNSIVQKSLAIYHKYVELKKEGRFEKVLQDIYTEGQLRNWKVPPSVL
jgi:PAB-dependent poly(A)-specific ribonuclease subunit 2